MPAMKKEVKLLIQQAQKAVSNPETFTKAEKAVLLENLNTITEKEGDKQPWWVVVLKILAYAIGLLLAGYGTTAAAATIWSM